MMFQIRASDLWGKKGGQGNVNEEIKFVRRNIIRGHVFFYATFQ